MKKIFLFLFIFFILSISLSFAGMKLDNNMFRLTPEGGIAIPMINDTGTTTVKGYLVDVSTNITNAFKIAPIDDLDVIGIVYESGITQGNSCYIVIQGYADVYFATSTARGNYARLCNSSDTGKANGYAFAENVPTTPFATDNHFREIGHVSESRTGAGLARCVLHFN
jgi:hypothetical protein